MNATRGWVLAAIAAVSASLGWGGALLIDGLGRALPQVPASAPSVLALFAATLFTLGFTTRARMRAARERPPGAKAMDPLLVARYAVLARASSPVGSGVMGLYAGYAVFLVPGLDQSGHRSLVGMAALAVASGFAVVVGALFLERICRVPGDGGPDNSSLPQPRDRAR
ncbi:MAG TPA: DUF3180 domain-containing protein [Sporichthyaceae bacterium]|jgi:hypothetical protein|nr:DUF3180 domain-containing protein [Sporichthyaceae bacterium]